VYIGLESLLVTSILIIQFYESLLVTLILIIQFYNCCMAAWELCRSPQSAWFVYCLGYYLV